MLAGIAFAAAIPLLVAAAGLFMRACDRLIGPDEEALVERVREEPAPPSTAVAIADELR